MNKQLVFLGVGACALVAITGCKNPFFSHPSDYGRELPLQKMHTVDTLPLDEWALDDDHTELAEEYIDHPPRNRFEGMDSFELDIEQARAWTLANNVDVRVALIEPTISTERLAAEEGKFEAVFFASARRTELDQPTSSDLQGSQVELNNFNAGFRIPLRTGGTITLESPFSRTSTDNEFTFLDPSYEVQPTFSISQPLLRNAGRRVNTHSIRVASLQSGITQTAAKLEVIRQVANVDRAYWRLYSARRALEVSLQQYDLAMDQLERARRRVRAGVVAEIEETRAEEGVAQRLQSIISDQNRVVQFQRNLKRIMNVSDLEMLDEILIVPETDPNPINFELDPGALATQAVENRMEMLELELQLAIDASTVDFTRNQALPLFTFDYSYNTNGLSDNTQSALRQARRDDFNDWTLGLNAEIPIAGNESAKARVQEAVLRRLQRLGTREARRLSIIQETLDAIDTLETNWQRILASRQTTILAERTLQAEQRQFDVGRSTSNDVLDAATRLALAQLTEIQSLRDYQIAQVDLAFATGTLLGASRVAWDEVDPRIQPAPYQEDDEPIAWPLQPDEMPEPEIERAPDIYGDS